MKIKFRKKNLGKINLNELFDNEGNLIGKNKIPPLGDKVFVDITPDSTITTDSHEAQSHQTGGQYYYGGVYTATINRNADIDTVTVPLPYTINENKKILYENIITQLLLKYKKPELVNYLTKIVNLVKQQKITEEEFDLIITYLNNNLSKFIIRDAE